MPRCYVHVCLFLFTIFVRETLGVTVQTGLYSRVELTGENLDNHTDLESVEWINLNKSCLCLNFVKQNGNITNYSQCCGKAHYYLSNNTLILENVTAQVEGVFMGKTIFNKSGITKQFNITLYIVYPPNATGIGVTWTSNTSVSLTCEVTATFTHIMWKREDSPILEDTRHSLSENNQTLNISNMTSSDDGKYSCVATNAYGKSETHTNVTWKTTTHPPRQDNSTLTIHQILFPSGLSIITILGLSTVIFCIIKYCHCRRGENDKATAGDANIDLRIYEEIPGIGEVVPLPCVYKDFIKPRQDHQDSAAAKHVEDFGYSEIGPTCNTTTILYPISSDEEFRSCPDAGVEVTADKINVSEATHISDNSSKLEEKQAVQLDQPQDEGKLVT
ncbi:uncharacterized protein [Paramisgurnus dabryanus]|uniref:uncharacterized protein n=1 Tax=Paramisgurnus dabryanus TaxID=90735 RepID=UPI0031F41CFE